MTDYKRDETPWWRRCDSSSSYGSSPSSYYRHGMFLLPCKSSPSTIMYNLCWLFILFLFSLYWLCCECASDMIKSWILNRYLWALSTWGYVTSIFTFFLNLWADSVWRFERIRVDSVADLFWIVDTRILSLLLSLSRSLCSLLLNSNLRTALQDKPYDSTEDELKATILEVVTTMKDLMRLNPLYKEHIQMFVQVRLILYFFFAWDLYCHADLSRMYAC